MTHPEAEPAAPAPRVVPELPDDILLRRGMFVVSLGMIEAGTALVAAIQADCIVINAQGRYDLGAIEYAALHPSFRPIAEGDVVPLYEAVIDKVADRVVWREIDRSPPRWAMPQIEIRH